MSESCLKIRLDGLDCAACAAKIEAALNKIEFVRSASVNFLELNAIIDYDSSVSEDEALGTFKKNINRLEPDISVEKVVENTQKMREHVKHKADIPKRKILQYGVGILLVVSSFFFESQSLKTAALLCAYIVFGYEVLIRLVRNLIKGQVFDENFLMGIATLGAIAIGEYAEAVGVMLFYNVGEFFQDLAVDKSRKSIKSLIGLKPEIATLVTESGTKEVDPQTVQVGSIIVVKPGERIPLDGIVIEGKTQLDTSALTGESVPRVAEVGTDVLSGSINIIGLIKIKTTKLFSESTVQKILDTVEKVSAKKAPTEQFITKFSKYYTPIVVIAAVLISFVPPLILHQPLISWVSRGLIFLVVSCPCALVLSVPLGYFAGLGACSRGGILVKGGNYLEALTKVKTMVFDKTGTLTKGVFVVSEIKTANGFSEKQILEAAANIEHFSNHPIAKSIVQHFHGAISEADVTNFEDIAGYGVKADFKGETCYLGKGSLMQRQKISFEEYSGIGSIVYIAIGGRFAGYIVVSDELKPDSAKAIKNLNSKGIKTIMLTGDKKSTADKVAEQLGISSCYSELLPEDKLNKLENIITETGKYKTAFVGDGINDAPALARADVSIAMGGLGQDAAIEASDIVIMNDNPERISEAYRVATKTQRIVWQNIVFALGIKGIILLLSALGFGNMWIATFADVGVALIAVANSMRVR